MFCGLYSIVLATGVGGDQNFYRAGLMILFAGVFDTIDGSVARLTKTGSEFGVQLDSLVDVVSFGIAPAIRVRVRAFFAAAAGGGGGGAGGVKKEVEKSFFRFELSCSLAQAPKKVDAAVTIPIT